MALRDDFKERVQSATDIVRLIGEHVALKPKGREFVGLCPFHDDKSPSMYVNPAKQIYKCFACGAGGDVFSFQMGYHKMTFPEAIRHLAERAGIPIEEQARGGGRDDGQPSDRKRIAAANELALGFFRTLLKHPEHGRIARAYIDRRGISPEMVAEFQIGYASDRWDGLALTAANKGWDRGALELAGLLKPRREGEGVYDALRHRLVFPICDSLGRPIAFGGRKLREEDEPKYLNSPETVLFNKSRTLYGLHLAKKPIIDSRTAVIVEGYVDVIACHQAGFRNVVATLGTALTAEHVSELRRFAERVVLIFDADAAGEKAADRAVELFLTGELDVCIAVLPQGPGGTKMDPGELLFTEEGPGLWRQAIDEAKDALEYQFARVRGRLEAAGGVTGRQRVAEEYIARVGQMGIARTGALRRSLVIQRLAGMLHMSEPQIDGLLKAATPRRAASATAPPAGSATAAPVADAAPWIEPVETDEAGGENTTDDEVATASAGPRLRAVHLAERQIIGCLLKDNALFTQPLTSGRSADESLPPEMFTHASTRRLYAKVHGVWCDQGHVTLTGLLADLASEGDEAGAALATQCDADAEKLSPGETTTTLFVKQAEAVLAYHEARAYLAHRQRVSEQDGDALAASARTLLEPLRETPRPRVTIFRG